MNLFYMHEETAHYFLLLYQFIHIFIKKKAFTFYHLFTKNQMDKVFKLLKTLTRNELEKK